MTIKKTFIVMHFKIYYRFQQLKYTIEAKTGTYKKAAPEQKASQQIVDFPSGKSGISSFLSMYGQSLNNILDPIHMYLVLSASVGAPAFSASFSAANSSLVNREGSEGKPQSVIDKQQAPESFKKIAHLKSDPSPPGHALYV